MGGIVECVKHGLLEPFNVLYERETELVAQFKYTVLLMPSGPKKITGLKFDPADMYESEHSIKDPEIKAILSTSVSSKAAKNKKKKAEKAMLNTKTPPAEPMKA